MPTRVIREGLLTSRRIDMLSEQAELFYHRVLLVVDDFGRYYAEPALLLAACFPRRARMYTDEQVKQWIADCAKANLISAYSVNGTDYIELKDFRQRTRSTSKFPGPDGVSDPREMSGKIYFLRASESGRIKIGYTEWKPEGRLLALQTGSHERLELLGWIPGTLKDERNIHKRFSVESLGGEWFSPSDELLKFIGESCAQIFTNASQCPPSVRASTPPTPTNVLSSKNPAEESTEMFKLETPETQPVKPASLESLQRQWFEQEFWPEYWRKVDKADALRAWGKHATSVAAKDRIVEAVKSQAPVYSGRDPEHRPHASTWLNKRRYEDPVEEFLQTAQKGDDW